MAHATGIAKNIWMNAWICNSKWQKNVNKAKRHRKEYFEGYSFIAVAKADFSYTGSEIVLRKTILV